MYSLSHIQNTLSLNSTENKKSKTQISSISNVNKDIIQVILPYFNNNEIKKFSLVDKSIRSLFVPIFRERICSIFDRLIKEINKRFPNHFIDENENEKKQDSLIIYPSFSFLPLLNLVSEVVTKTKKIFVKIEPKDLKILQFCLTGCDGYKSVIEKEMPIHHLFIQYKKTSLFLERVFKLEYDRYKKEKENLNIYYRILHLISIKNFEQAFNVLNTMNSYALDPTYIKAQAFAHILNSFANEYGEESALAKIDHKIHDLEASIIFKFLLKFNQISLAKKTASRLFAQKESPHNNSVYLDYISALIEANHTSEAVEIEKMMPDQTAPEKECKRQALGKIICARIERRESVFDIAQAYPIDVGYILSKPDQSKLLAHIFARLEKEGMKGVIELLKSDKGNFFGYTRPKTLEILIQRGDFKDALELVTDVRDEEFYAKMIVSLFKQGKEEEASSLIEKVTSTVHLDYIYYEQALFSITKGGIKKGIRLMAETSKKNSQSHLCNLAAIESFKLGKMEDAIEYFYRSSEYSSMHSFRYFSSEKQHALIQIARYLMKENRFTPSDFLQFLNKSHILDATIQLPLPKIYGEIFSFLIRIGRKESILTFIDGLEKQSDHMREPVARIAALAIAEQANGKTALKWVDDLSIPLYRKFNIYSDLAIFLAKQGRESLPEAIEAFMKAGRDAHSALIAIGKAKIEYTEKERVFEFIRKILASKGDGIMDSLSEKFVFSQLAIEFAFQKKEELALYFAEALSEKDQTFKINVLEGVKYWKKNSRIEYPFFQDFFDKSTD